MRAHPEVSARNKSFGALRDSGMLAGDEQTAIDPALAPEPGDVEVHRVLLDKVFPRQAEVVDVAAWAAAASSPADE